MDTSEHDQPRPAPHVDWQQVVLNGGPPCFHVDPAEPNRYCGRAERWAGHESRFVGHKFISLDELLATKVKEAMHQAILIVDTAPLYHCEGKQYVDPVALVQRMNAALEAGC